jgi:hypothetical protein
MLLAKENRKEFKAWAKAQPFFIAFPPILLASTTLRFFNIFRYNFQN